MTIDWQAVGAIGTFTAVLVALFAQHFRDKFFPPKLSIYLLTHDGERTEAILAAPENPYGEREKRTVPARYYHLRVTNNRRWAKATNVQVLLLRVQEKGVNEEWTITWSGALPLEWRHQELYPISRTIGADADVDLCSVLKDKWLHVHALVEPSNLKLRRREACSLILHVQAQASETNSQVLRLRIAWDGKWEDGAAEMRRHLAIEPLHENPYKPLTFGVAADPRPPAPM